MAGKRSLRQRVQTAAEAALGEAESVSPVDVFGRIGWLSRSGLDGWRQGRPAHLDQAMDVTPARLAEALGELAGWARAHGLVPGEIRYLAASRDGRELRFTTAGDPAAEKACRTHWTSPGLSEARRSKLTQRQSRAPDLVVVEPVKEFTCADADVRERRRERDAERRAHQDLEFQARLARELARLYPGCPSGRPGAIAQHAGARGSGRVGRTAAARALDPDAIHRAVVASIRHEDTAYDRLLMDGMPREEAREEVRTAIGNVLDAWQRRR